MLKVPVKTETCARTGIAVCLLKRIVRRSTQINEAYSKFAYKGLKLNQGCNLNTC